MSAHVEEFKATAILAVKRQKLKDLEDAIIYYAGIKLRKQVLDTPLPPELIVSETLQVF